jgi:hypothetical protein
MFEAEVQTRYLLGSTISTSAIAETDEMQTSSSLPSPSILLVDF